MPVIVADHLSESEKQAFAIADNQIALHASWDNEILKVQLELLRQEGMNLKLVGFSEEEFSALVDALEANNRLEDEDTVPELPEIAVTEAGDLWELGNHLLFCGDATADEAYQSLLGGELAGLVFTDPPYNVAYRAPLAPDGSVRHAPITNDDLGGGFAALMAGACRKMFDHHLRSGCTSACVVLGAAHALQSI